MSRKIWCDLCGIELGTEHTIGTTFHSDEPGWHDCMPCTGGNQPYQVDYCRDCEEELNKAVHDTLERLKKKKDVGKNDC